LTDVELPTGSVGSEAAALSCSVTVSGTCNISMNTIALTTTAISGGRKSTGCPRIAAAQVRAVVRARSAAMAAAIAGAGRVGPWPMRALLRIRLSAARRWAGVSPGSK
jgi:hypothetical protein